MGRSAKEEGYGREEDGGKEEVIDTNILVAVITSVTSAASTAGVAITAIVINNKRFELLEKRLDKIETKLEGIDTRLNEITLDIAKLKLGYHE
jgi:hypothetical protein